jgi:hypothetical protein
MHPSITGVAANEYPTIDEMSEYTNTHANRYDSKGEVDHLNETIRGKDFEMEQQLQQLMDELDDDSDDDTDDDSLRRRLYKRDHEERYGEEDGGDGNGI